MTGKEKCRLLRQIRKEIAATNQIPYFPTECTYKGDDCTGTCPMCEAEAAYLDRKLNEKAATGAAITLSGVSLNTFNETCVDPFGGEEIFFEEAGVMACDEDPAPKSPRDMTIEEMPFPEECLIALKAANIHTVAQLLQISGRELCTSHQIPFNQVDTIRKVLGRYGLFMKPDIDIPPLMGVMIPRDQTPGYMVPNDEDKTRHNRSDERLKGALRPKDLRKMKEELEISRLGLSVRTLRVLLRSDIMTISQLIALSVEDLTNLDGIRKRHLDEIVQKVHDKGLYFKGETR